MISARFVAFVGGAVGIVFLVLGLVGLARTGIPMDTITAPTVSVGPFSRTPIMAIIEVVLGVVLIGASASRDPGTVTGIGLITLVFGIVWLIEPGAFRVLLGVGRETAVLYLALGGVLLGTGFLGPRTTVAETTRSLPTD
jgi:hypothetical protein